MMRMIRILLTALGLSVLALATTGQEAEDEPETPPPAAGAAAQDAPRDTADEVFVPTVEVQADEEVVFPVDI
ncbi:hypothetical protein [Candidatus Rariloculus sp.]|uniref:hypothetical protein n=1 Tax=Candidatus Rariloculus sp. TaxID=3101265 RepID=UPI003D0E0860